MSPPGWNGGGSGYRYASDYPIKQINKLIGIVYKNKLLKFTFKYVKYWEKE